MTKLIVLLSISDNIWLLYYMVEHVLNAARRRKFVHTSHLVSIRFLTSWLSRYPVHVDVDFPWNMFITNRLPSLVLGGCSRRGKQWLALCSVRCFRWVKIFDLTSLTVVCHLCQGLSATANFNWRYGSNAAGTVWYDRHDWSTQDIPWLRNTVMPQLSIEACPNTWLPKTLTSIQLQLNTKKLFPGVVPFSPSKHTS